MDCGNLDASKGCPIENINPPLLMHNAADKYSNNNFLPLAIKKITKNLFL